MIERLQRVISVLLLTVILVLTQIQPSNAQQQNEGDLPWKTCDKQEKPVPIVPFSKLREPKKYEFLKAGKPENDADWKKLEVQYVKYKIEGGATLCLRSYISDAGVGDETELVGPTLYTEPGKTISLKLYNKLDPSDKWGPTNFHSHGLHVSPKGISDNVLRTMAPTETPYDIVIEVPTTQPGGTDWYHPHGHGTTAVQVANGMEGALIVGNGAMDKVLPLQQLKDRILVLQQIPFDKQYGTVIGKDVNIVSETSNGNITVGGTDKGTWINGQIVPTIEMYAGEVERWRFIHAGERSKLDLQLALDEPAGKAGVESYEQGRQELATAMGQTGPQEVSDTMAAQLPRGFGEKQLLHEIAVDGMPLGFIDSWDKLTLYPGYRSDVLVQIKNEGTYWLYDEATKNGLSLNGLTLNNEPTQLIAKVVVKANREPVHQAQQGSVIEAQEIPNESTWWKGDWYNEDTNVPEAKVFRGYLLGELQAAKKKERILEDIVQDEYKGGPLEAVTFQGFKLVNGESFQLTQGETQVVVKPTPLSLFTRSSMDDEIDLKKPTANKWKLSAITGAHPFHIHVNPFQVMRKGPIGKWEKIWKDTQIVSQNCLLDAGCKGIDPEDGNNLTVVSRNLDYDGCAVLHCHILPHEDNGMMALVKYSLKTAEEEVSNDECYQQKLVGHKASEYEKAKL